MLQQYGDGAALLAGGTDLAVWIKEGRLAPACLIDIKGVEGLAKLGRRGGDFFIGSAVTFSMLRQNEDVRNSFPILWESAGAVASVSIRNRATLVGNICSAVPSLDAAPALLVYDASVQVTGARGERVVKITDWFKGVRRTALQPGEIVTGVTLTSVPQRHAGCYVKLARYAGEDLAQAGLAILVTDDHKVRIAHTAVAPFPGRVPALEALLTGREPGAVHWAEAGELLAAAISPINDIRASQAYRFAMIKVMLERGLKAAWARLDGKEVDVSRILGD